MQPEPEAYLASLRRELFALTENLDDDTANGIRFCVDKMVSQLITRSSEGPGLNREFEDQARALFDEFCLTFPESETEDIFIRRQQLLQAIEDVIDNNAVPDIKGFSTRAALIDDGHRRRFISLSEQKEAEIARSPNIEPWRITRERIESGLPQLLPRWQGARVENLKRISGIHSKEIYFVDVFTADGKKEPVVIRCDRNENVTRTSVADEFPLLCELYRRGFIIPEPLAATSDLTIFGQPAVIMRRVLEGREKLAEELTDGRRVMLDIARFLARLHTTSLEYLGLKRNRIPESIKVLWLERIQDVYDWWRQNAVEPAPIMQYARQWLSENATSVADALVLAHGDFSLRNVLIDDNDQLVAVLDWDLAHLGHPAVDLGYIRASVESLMPWEEFMAEYRSHGGCDITRDQIRFFDIWGMYRNLAINTTAQHLFLTNQTQDPFFGTTAIYYHPSFFSTLTELLVPSSKT